MRNVRYLLLMSALGLAFASVVAVILVMTNRVGSTASFNLTVSFLAGLVTWVCLKAVIYSKVGIGDGFFFVRGAFRDRVITFSEVDSVCAHDGLFLLVQGGSRVTLPGFEPSAFGALRGYRSYSGACDEISGALSEWKENGSPSPGSGKTRVRPDVMLLVVSLLLYSGVWQFSVLLL
ncbi:hypothetical protein H4W79_001752 [Nocardiopsis terrae]|uniref:PH domain-containing protein n=1 Tax=Nocardiopsis terrae TaxID=372655 RepID=A0ABR9HET0_9ACTN|nr:hypothetical protein [Nocardiopsis terrae]MBE1457538.1 hypothetical protein [Nocardiopsis terrae]